MYKELAIEFFSAVVFLHSIEDMAYDKAFQFRLGGAKWSISLLELAWRLDLYTIEETEDDACLAYLNQCIRVPSQNFQHSEIWKKFGDEFVAYNKKETTIDNIIQPIHRLLHQMLINSICHREDKRKNVLENDVFLLHCLIDNQVHLNIPFMMAIFLSYSSLRDRYTQPFWGA